MECLEESFVSDHAPKISVIIHFLNAARHLGESIRSVTWQTVREWELILVDGGSTDDSGAIAADAVRRDPDRVRLVSFPGPGTLGIFSSRIMGARHASAHVLAHLDSDDEWHPQFLARQYAVHHAQFASRPGLVYCPMVYWWEEAGRALDSYVQPVPPAGLYDPPGLVARFLDDHYSRSPGNSAVMVSREIVLAAAELIGTADEGIAEDQFLWSFVALRYPICVHPDPLVRYRQWAGSACARSVADGNFLRPRATHLAWLEHYLSEQYAGDQKQALLEACRAAAGKRERAGVTDIDRSGSR